jgi:YD repeat-containing protein
MRGLRLDRLLLTTDTTYIPAGEGPAETTRLLDQTTISTTLTRTIVYTYDHFYRLTGAAYSTGEFFSYTYDPNGNRTTQTTLTGMTVYTYDVANRLTQVDGQAYQWDNNGNLTGDGLRTFTYDTANRLTGVTGGITASFEYNGDGDRLAQTVNGVTAKPPFISQDWRSKRPAGGSISRRTGWGVSDKWLTRPGRYCWHRATPRLGMCLSGAVRIRVHSATPASRWTRPGWSISGLGTTSPQPGVSSRRIVSSPIR